MKKLIATIFLLSFIVIGSFCQSKNNFAVIAYYSGRSISQIDSFPIEKLTHIIFSFCHLSGNQLHVDRAADTAMIEKMISLKQRNPNLKVLLSLGGWGGCSTCSDVFSTRKGRKEFAESVKTISNYFRTDGIDLDWEYPAIEGFPNHKFQKEDKENFTALINELRKTLGKQAVISFAAGGFGKYIDESVEWKKVARKVNYVNLMTYDLVSGFATKTGHHTPLYSTDSQVESIDNAIEKLVGYKMPKSKLVIGAAFYGRMWGDVPDTNSGLYQPGKFVRGISYKNFQSQLPADSGFVYYWDDKAMAPYLYNKSQHLFVTYDDKRSIQLKTKYALDKKLGGIMFWQLTEDAYEDGLLDVIDETKIKYTKQ